MSYLWQDVVIATTRSPARRLLDAPMLALAAATPEIIGIAQPPKSMPVLR